MNTTNESMAEMLRAVFKGSLKDLRLKFVDRAGTASIQINGGVYLSPVGDGNWSIISTRHPSGILAECEPDHENAFDHGHFTELAAVTEVGQILIGEILDRGLENALADRDARMQSEVMGDSGYWGSAEELGAYQALHMSTK